jgi:hypothetical protein
VDSRAVVWIREFCLGRTQRVRVGGKLSEDVRVRSGVPQESVLGEILSQALGLSQKTIIYWKILNNN